MPVDVEVYHKKFYNLLFKIIDFGVNVEESFEWN